MRLILVILFVSIVCGCSAPKTIPWEKSEIAGYIFDLNSTDTDIVEQLSFGGNGLVDVSIGTKKGGVAGPEWYWKIDASGALVVTDDDLPRITLQKIRSRDNTVEVLRDGKPATYRVKKEK